MKDIYFIMSAHEAKYRIVSGDNHVYPVPIVEDLGESVQSYTRDGAIAVTALAHAIHAGHAPFGYRAGFKENTRPTPETVVNAIAVDCSNLAQFALRGMLEMDIQSA